MSDLHKPLAGQVGKSGNVQRKRTLLWLSVGAAALGLTSFLAYILIDARNDSRSVVALGPEQVVLPQNGAGDKNGQQSGSNTNSSSKTDGTAAQGTVDGPTGPLDLSKVKRLTPLEPMSPDESEGAADQPAFAPAPQPPRNLNVDRPVLDLTEKSEFGLLPRISEGGVRPLDAYSQSSGASGANRVAIIVGGLGLSQTGTQRAIRALPSQITLGFSPLGNSLQRWMSVSRKEGHEVVLQLPMEPLGYPAINPGPRTLVSAASRGENLKNLRWALGRMTNYPLVMNYLGAGLSGKVDAMRPLLEEIRNRGLGYIDDGTVLASASGNLAQGMRLPHAQGVITLDSSRQPERIKASLARLEAVARQRGYAIGTASAFPETVKAVTEWAQAAAKRGVTIVPASNLLRDYSR